jgi:hypothetical protein
MADYTYATTYAGLVRTVVAPSAPAPTPAGQGRGAVQTIAGPALPPATRWDIDFRAG